MARRFDDDGLHYHIVSQLGIWVSERHVSQTEDWPPLPCGQRKILCRVVALIEGEGIQVGQAPGVAD